MKTVRAAPVGTMAARPRKHRSRTLPKWLVNSTQLEAIARSRCLMVLSVLSGEKPVTEAILEGKISRGTYYQLETRALKAMLTAMNPLAASSAQGAVDLSAATDQITHLQQQVQRLEQEKRRSQRLLLLTRKTLRAPLTTGHRGRWPRPKPSTSVAPGARRKSLPSSPTPPGEPSP